MSEIKIAWSNSQCVAGAFDRVWHAGLLKKLIAGGMCERAIRFMKGYLKNRFIQVVIGKQKS